MSKNDLEHSLKSGPKPVNLQKGASRLIPVVVVFGTVTGFMALAWYAYQAGSQSLGEDELLVVQADKSPVKEKPSDPGGMQFPNQDKTIFDTFSGDEKPLAKVEKVLPAPEEPIVRMDMSNTTTWINKKLHKHPAQAHEEAQDVKIEQVIGNDGKQEASPKSSPEKAELAVAEKPLFTVTPEEQADGAKVLHISRNEAGTNAAADKAAQAEANAAKEKADKEAAEAKVAKEKEAAQAKAAEEKALREAAQAKAKAEKEKAAKAKAAAKEKAAKEKAMAKSTGEFNVQLGAFRSYGEAKAAWASMQKKYKQLDNMTPVIIKADLGAKGIYYRLRTGGFASAGEAKAFCNTMSILKQACLVPAR